MVLNWLDLWMSKNDNLSSVISPTTTDERVNKVVVRVSSSKFPPSNKMNQK